MADKKRYVLKNKRKHNIFIAVSALIVVSAIVACILLIQNAAEKRSSPIPVSSSASKAQTTAAPETTSAAAAVSVVFGTDSTYVSQHDYCIAVNRATNTVTIYGKDSSGTYNDPVKAMCCSVGKAGHETPVGTYKIALKYAWLKMVDDSYGQYACQFYQSWWIHSVTYYTQDKSNIEYDEYNKLGTAASLGCVRLCVADAKWIYDNCGEGTIVKIFDGTASDDPLGKPKAETIDTKSANRGWDPTDPDPANPWNS